MIRIARFVLSGEERDPWIADFFAPEQVDLSRLAAAARGARVADGVDIVLGERPDATVLVFRRGAVTREMLDRHRELRLVQRLGERADDIDLAAAADRGVHVSCMPRRTLHYTAEHALLLMLALAKRLLAADRSVREGGYDLVRVRPQDDVAYNWPGFTDASGLYGKTLGIVGLGEVGTLVARLARAFGMRVIYHQRRRASPAQEAALGCAYATPAELLARSDFVSLHAANLPENDRLANAAFFAGMKPTAFFINMSRGRLVDEDALYAALVARAIAGAGLDVHRVEPRPAHDRFAALPNVVLTPHIGGGARSGVLDELEVLLGNCASALRGEPPRHEVRA
ncbi:MAG TPA: NAD(P)-dependent oxidoreductase [Burkholderiales bacterium]|nr:NAD(P)-dependent oxidoreductase [Burkholderiales bacterium]